MEQQKKHGIYHTTSIETAKTTYTTVALAGQKRPFGGLGSKKDESLQGSKTYQGNFQKPQPPQKLYPALQVGAIIGVNSSRSGEYSQRKSLALTPNPTCNPLLDLSHPNFGLSPSLVRNLAALGVKSIYPWQSECLLRSGALQGNKNLVYTAPTGGGKSLVADILMLKKVIECPGKKAILVLPYVALVQEKIRWLRNLVDGLSKNTSTSSSQQVQNTIFSRLGNEDSVRVVGSFGGSKSKVSWNDMDIAVCTIEKANSLVNAAIEERTVGNLGIVVMDELHMIDDENRGYILELMATKLLTLSHTIQIVGMSATLNNAKQLAKWLGNARYYHSRYKPVPIEEHLVFDNSIYSAVGASKFYKTAIELAQTSSPLANEQSEGKPEPCRLIDSSPDKELSSSLVNSVVSLAYETAQSGYGALVFCSSRSGCERDAILISQVMPRHDIDTFTRDKRSELLADLRSTSTGLDSVLEKIIPVGVAFHHAGLTTEERDLIATAYDLGVVKVIVATCSLAAGINLPARRVILHGARMGADMVGPSMLRQMRGRAGRKGKDEIGETYLCCEKDDLEEVAQLMEAEIPDVKSSLMPGKRGTKRALLEAVATTLATSTESLDEYMSKTLLQCSVDDQDDLSITQSALTEMVNMTLQELEDTKLIERNATDLKATLLGQAIVASSLTPEDGLFVYKELSKALQAFVMDGEMHVLYIFTPVQAAQSNVNWKTFLNEIEVFDESNMRAMTFIGLKPSTINKMAQGSTMKESTDEEVDTLRVYKRFYAALQLRDLCNEMPIHAVARKYDLPRGIVQNLAQTCQGFAAGMIQFCQRMQWGALAAVLDHFSDRLKAGAKADLLTLAQISYIKSRTARVFWENGFKTVASIASADPKDILPVLLQAQPKKLKVDGKEEVDYHAKLLAKATFICKKANDLWEREMMMQLDQDDL